MQDARLAEILENLRDEGRSASAQGSIPPAVALRALLERILQADGLLAGIVWLRDEQDRVRVLCESGLQALFPDGRFVVGPQHQQQLNIVLREGRIVCVKLKSADGREPECGIAAGPLFRQSQTIGVLELFATPDLPEPEVRLLLQSLELLCEIGGELLFPNAPPGPKPVPAPHPAVSRRGATGPGSAVPPPGATGPAGAVSGAPRSRTGGASGAPRSESLPEPKPAPGPTTATQSKPGPGPGPAPVANQELQPELENAEFWARFDQFTLNLQRSLDVAEVAAIAVNDAKLLLGCDRVSLALQRGTFAVVQAVSGQERVQSRSNLIRHMVRLAEAVISSGEIITYRGDVEGFAPQIERPLADYVAESRSRMIMLAPVRRSPPLQRSDDLSKRSAPRVGEVIGCLVLEQSAEAQPRPTLQRRLDLVSDHVAAALSNAREHSELFLLPLWRTLGRGLAWLRGRRGWMAAAIVLGLVLIGAALAFVPWDYRVEASGRAMPVVRSDVFAPWDGDVVEVFVHSGDKVKARDPLVRIESDELNEKYIVARNAVFELQKQRDSLRVQLREALEGADRQEQRRLGGELMAARIQLTAAEEHERNLAERIDRLTTRAAIDGVVVTYQLSQNLEDRPVNRGELLLQVMNDAGPWRLELEVPDDRMGHVLRAAAESDSGDLSVEYVPATAVELTLPATIRRESIATRSNQSAETGTIVEAFADIDPNDLPQRHIGADVTARIDCGQRSLGYVLFGDVVEFLQRHIWW
jgi:multidrug efflux pump subunit AcrA (membrane-fusion protein)